MKTKINLFIFLILILLATASVSAENMVVIVNSSNLQNLTKDDIKNIYSDRIITWKNGDKITVYNLPVESSGREVFSQAVMGLSAQSMAAKESNRSITNTVRNPQKLKRERLVVSIVSKNPNAIGYVTEASAKAKSGLRILFVVN